MDFNTPIDITKLPPIPLDLVDDTPFNDTPVPPPRKRGRPRKSEQEKFATYVPKPKKKTTAKTDEPRGTEALSEVDKRYIEENARAIPYEEIADHIDKKRNTVFRYMERHGLLSEEDKRDSKIKRAILNDLHNQQFWRVVLASNSSEEVEYFEDTWCKFVIQLDDNVTPTEQIQLRQLIDTQIMIDRLAVITRKASMEIERMDAEIVQLEEQMEAEVDEEVAMGLYGRSTTLKQERTTAGLTFANSSTETGKLVKTLNELTKLLDVTRASRVEKYDMSDKTWSKMLLAIKEEPRLKKQLGALAYISMLATERIRAKLTQPYTYANGEENFPMLLPENTINRELTDMIEEMYVPKVETA